MEHNSCLSLFSARERVNARDTSWTACENVLITRMWHGSDFFTSYQELQQERLREKNKTHLPVVLVIIHLFPGGWIKDFPPDNETYVKENTQLYS